MINLPYKNKISPKMKALLIIFSLFIIGIIIGQVISNIGAIYIKDIVDNSGYNVSPRLERNILNGYKWLLTIICINLTLLITVLVIYIKTYKKTKSSFILGLNLFIGILLTKSCLLLANLLPFFNKSIYLLPAAIITLGTLGFGMLGIFINIFEIIAISILLYLSLE